MISYLLLAGTLLLSSPQNKRSESKQDTVKKTTTIDSASLAKKADSLKAAANKLPYKPYKEVITAKAKTKKGLFTVHFVDDKYYFEIPDSLLNKEFLAVTRFIKVPGGTSRYAGEEVNEQTLQFTSGPSNKIFLKLITLINYADSTQTISKAVKNSNLDPIIASFDIKTVGKDSSSWVIDVTDFFKGDNLAVSLSSYDKSIFSLSSLLSDRSFIQTINTYPQNTEIKTTKTFAAITPSPFSAAPPPRFPILPAAANAGVLTFELNTSLILLPEKPMVKRFFDKRVGYFADDYTVFTDGQQKVDHEIFAVRYRLEPKPEDLEKYKKGELVEPQKPIVYYIDPATPKQWVPYLIQGVNDWSVAFEKAGFKNAIMGKEWPENDSTMSLEDARFCVLRYFASPIENAYGPQVHDPRTGEILESHIGWYHNVMRLLHDWYFIQTAAVDTGARKMTFDDKLMGQLIRFVSSHEVGHTLGLRHNMGSSSQTPVENLRSKAWVEANGHTVSIMDYARFNYVAQPEDNIGRVGLFPRIGDYDKWAIEWGYKYTGIQNPEEDYQLMNPIVIARLKENPKLWFGGESYNDDPRAQTEDLGNNSVLASEYGIKNLKRIVSNLETWTKEDGDDYKNLKEMYNQITFQFQRYMGHVTKNIGGVYETFKTVDQPGDVYEPTPKNIQKSAMQFLQNQLFETPTWLINKSILNKISAPIFFERVQSIQSITLTNLLSPNRMYRLVASANRFGANTYTLPDMLNELRQGLFKELISLKPIEVNRRNLQKIYVEKLNDIINITAPAQPSVLVESPYGSFASVNIKNTDIPAEVRGQLRSILTLINANIEKYTDASTKHHLYELKERILYGLDPKK